jgi:nucleoside phosphorylase
MHNDLCRDSLGDIVVPTQTFHYQFGSYKDGVIHPELRVENSDRQLLDVVNHIARRTDALTRIKNALPRGFKKPLAELQCHFGPMASADLVVKDPNKIQQAIEADRKTIAVEMESYAFMKAAALARVRWVLVSKSVTDYADATKDDEFREYAKYTSTSFFVEVARTLFSNGHIG